MGHFVHRSTSVFTLTLKYLQQNKVSYMSAIHTLRGVISGLVLLLASAAWGQSSTVLELVEGQAASWAQAGVVMEFKGYSDERCRRELKPCTSHGASVDALVHLGDAPPREVRLRMGQPEQHEPFARVGAFQLELVSLQPVGRALPKDDPAVRRHAKVRVTRAERVSVAQGERIALPESQLTIDFVALDDHRCPTGVACGTAGWATARLSVRTAETSAPTTLTLWGPNHLPYAVVNGYEIELCSVEPRPMASTGKALGTVRAELFVIAATTPAPQRGPRKLCQ